MRTRECRWHSTLLRLVEANDDSAPYTVRSQTPRGGGHLFFRWPEGADIRNSVGQIAPGIDVRGTAASSSCRRAHERRAEHRWDISPEREIEEAPDCSSHW
jgi:hypothetical protein